MPLQPITKQLEPLSFRFSLFRLAVTLNPLNLGTQAWRQLLDPVSTLTMQCCKSFSLAASLIPANTSRSHTEIKAAAAVEVLQAHYSHCLIQPLLSLCSLSRLLKSRTQNLKGERGRWRQSGRESTRAEKIME